MVQAWVARAVTSDKVPHVGPRPRSARYRKAGPPPPPCPRCSTFSSSRTCRLQALYACVLSCFSRFRLFATPRALAHQAPLSMEFSRQERWSVLPFLSPGDLSDPGTEALSPAWQAVSFPLSHLGSSFRSLMSPQRSFVFL